MNERRQRMVRDTVHGALRDLNQAIVRAAHGAVLLRGEVAPEHQELSSALELTHGALLDAREQLIAAFHERWRLANRVHQGATPARDRESTP